MTLAAPKPSGHGQPSPTLPRETFSVSDIQAITGLGRDKVQELLRVGAIPSVKAGRRYLVTRAHLDAFLRGEAEAR